MLNTHGIIGPVMTLLVGALWLVPVDDGLPADTAPPADYSAIDPPYLEFAWHRGGLKLAGHTASRRHERELLQAAKHYYSGAPRDTAFAPMGTVPDFWHASSLVLLDALSTTLSGTVLLRGDRVSIRGVSTPAWQETSRRLRASLPRPLNLDVDVTIVGGIRDARAMCERAFSAFETGSIRFEESTTKLRDAARPALDRAISLADACRGSSVRITGHTDSSGPESWNRELSLARAQAVADYLEKGGIARQRLLAFGKGSSEPIASNESRYARSMNRRITIEFIDDR